MATDTRIPTLEDRAAAIETRGTLCGVTLAGIGAATEAPATSSHPVRAYTLAAQTALDATEAISGMTAVSNIPWAFARYA